jgi:hypothetical protein
MRMANVENGARTLERPETNPYEMTPPSNGGGEGGIVKICLPELVGCIKGLTTRAMTTQNRLGATSACIKARVGLTELTMSPAMDWLGVKADLNHLNQRPFRRAPILSSVRGSS